MTLGNYNINYELYDHKWRFVIRQNDTDKVVKTFLDEAEAMTYFEELEE